MSGTVATRGSAPRRPLGLRGTPAEKGRWKRPVYGLLGVVLLLGVWELLARVGVVDALLFSRPSDVAGSFATAVGQGAVVHDIGVSAVEIVCGLLGAVAVGVPVGVLCGWNKWVFFAVDPWLTILYALPIVALAPLMINVVGIGLGAKVLLVFLFAVFPVAINTLTGVQATSNQYLGVAHVYGARRAMVLRSILLPGALPYILTGLRLAGGRALVGMVVAEFTASEEGIGFRLQVAGSSLQTGLLLSLVVLLGLVGVLYSAGIRALDNRLSAWRRDR
ncbi:ABC transporter permease [Streptomyces sp. NPDC050560]|uniref:ABC transporter permease n=1 Tax=Streptomyces sp. NPDC050560 TaxID=3365630 RepID=UPI0037A724AC